MKQILNINWNSLRAYTGLLVAMLLCFCIILISPIGIHAQKSSKKVISKKELIALLATNMGKGDKIALRDMAKLYDKNPKNQEVKQLLKRHTLFTKEEWNWDQPRNNRSFTHFFYEKEVELKFSELLAVFYLTPIESWAPKVSLQPKKSRQIDPFSIRQSLQKIDTYLRKKEAKGLLKEIEQIGKLKNTNIVEILKELIAKKELNNFKKAEKEVIFTEIMAHLPDSLAFDELLELSSKKVFPLSYCQRELAKISNNYIIATDREQLVAAYKKLKLDFDNSLTAIKEYGYKKMDITSALFFKESVDYYGWLLANCPDSLYWIQRNAIKDMVALHHPKAIFYIAGLQFRQWKNTNNNQLVYRKLIQQNIDVTIKVKEGKKWQEHPSTEQGQSTLISYWSIHYDDYEWDDFEHRFVNQQLFSNELEAYDRYFRRLNSTNDTIAHKAFDALCMGKPNEIQKLIKKFKPLLRNYNPTLPPLKYKILEQVSLLTNFCHQHHINYIPKGDIKESLEKLNGNLSPKERLKIENKLVEELRIPEFTVLEYYAAINAQNLELNYSIGRILDYLYSKHWTQMIGNERFFRLFLLKVQLFKEFGGFGICKKYAQKVELENPQVLQFLETLKNLETNPYIQQSIQWFLEQKITITESQKIAKFLSNPGILDKQGLKELPPLPIQDVHKIVQELFLQSDKKATKNIGDYLELYASLEIIPQLFEMPKNQWNANKYAGKALVNVLERVYQFSFSTKSQESIEQWWGLWQKQPEDYKYWSKYLFEQQLAYLTSASTLTINDINKVTKSPYYQDANRALCLQSLSKIKSKTIYRLQIKPKISVERELFYLDSILFRIKDLDNIPKISVLDNPSKLLDFIYQKSVAATITEKSSLYNNLFRQAWFIDHITSGHINPIKCNALKLIFYKYLSQSTFLTEYEEQATQLNIIHLENAYLTVSEKLARIQKDSLNEAIRYEYLNVTMSRVAFSELLIAFPILKDLSIPNKNPFLFLNRDFGLPIFTIPNEKSAQTIIAQLKTLNEIEFYKKTLVDFGLPILQKNGQLHYQNIYELLAYDLVVPFLGEGGKYRDYYTYGLVKLLELHFETTLGFHTKLNENQTFYTFNSNKRVTAWKAYLKEQGLVKMVQDNRSFN